MDGTEKYTNLSSFGHRYFVASCCRPYKGDAGMAGLPIYITGVVLHTF